METGAAKPGDLALLIGYGAGLSYAAQVVRMPPSDAQLISLPVGRSSVRGSRNFLAAQPSPQSFAFPTPPLPPDASAAVARRRSGLNSQIPRGIAMINANNTATTMGNPLTPSSRATP